MPADTEEFSSPVCAVRVTPGILLADMELTRRVARELSDIDFIVVKTDERTFKERMDYLYTRIDREDEIDMFWYTPQELVRMAPSNSFIRQVLREGETLYERE